MYEAPWYLWAMVLVTVLGFAISIGFIVDRSGLGREASRARRLGATVSLLVIGWAALSALLSAVGLFSGDVGGSVPWIPIFFSVTLLGLLWLTRSLPSSTGMDSTRFLQVLTLPHTLRVMGGVFVIAMAQGALPETFALPAGLGDIAIGLAAPFVAMRLARGEGTRGAVWFNVLGLADLAIAITIGFLAASGPFQLLDVQPTTDVLPLLPFALIPTVAVPIAITLHVVALRHIRKRSSEDSRVPAASVGAG